MKNYLITAILLVFVAQVGFGQATVRVFNYRPTGEFGFVMKPLTSVEVAWQARFSKRPTKRWRSGISLLYLPLQPRLAVFPLYGVLQDGRGTTIVPTAQAYQQYTMFQLAMGSDYALVHRKKFNFYVGADLVAGAAKVDYTYAGLTDESYQGGSILAGFRARVGAEYAVTSHIGVFVTANREGFLMAEPKAYLAANDYGIGLRYSFN